MFAHASFKIFAFLSFRALFKHGTWSLLPQQSSTQQLHGLFRAHAVLNGEGGRQSQASLAFKA